MTTYYTKQLFDGQTLHHNCVLTTESGRVKSIENNLSFTGDAFDGIICPGFIDTQVNGGGGFMLNHDPSRKAVDGIAKAHQQFGTTALLPTLITDRQDKMLVAADTIAAAIAGNHQSVIGVHFEGPHLSTAKRGIHSSDSIRKINDNDIDMYLRNDLGKVMLTIAPESLSPDIIKELSEKGVFISLGHSNADVDTVIAAIDAGATAFTHLFNAMSGLKAREPGMIGAALIHQHAYVGLIADMHHVHPANCLLAANCIGADRLMLVTDAMAHVGSAMQNMKWENTVITRYGEKLLTEEGTFAGSCLDMANAVKNMVNQVGIELGEVLKMATSTPAQFLNLTGRGVLKPGCRADFVHLDHNLSVRQCWVGGQPMLDNN
ncbi:N-acetylglucosamine-6-phosphate deacetylase [Alteromonas sp. ASW11-130]|uniref:N-acetylglucosamine-6-phosphate deacetylase n=1 Tax=Alteromonas sp. ASW11-130 TaxID=3015775 RepID=UPI002242604B|nr:N-acetylglucosamine-6-phosphate deacetylase [Alteromonas sp. ASW11-130]MCW8092316.1 N-acetylglucosamine-6-phosphate deacetylase [Alteromonas sp. ASW11-130]